MDQIAQEINERRFNRKLIDGYIREAIQASSDLKARVNQGVGLIEDWMYGSYYQSKMNRLAQLHNMDIEALVTDMFVGIAYCLREELFTSVTAQMAGRLKFSDKGEAITTIAEMMAVLCNTDMFDINKESKYASLYILSKIPLSVALVTLIEESRCLPPMVCEPLELRGNYDSGYLTHKESLILGSNNHHDGDLCLDVLNTMNRVELKLDTRFLSTVEEMPTHELDTPQKIDNWKMFKRHSYQMYSLMASQGNRFHLTHQVDKRGRIYPKGYHITTAGNSFKKAMLELANEEHVEGVPTW